VASYLFAVLPSSALALGTTVHLALSALRHHRRPGTGAFSPLTAISIVLSVTPWVFPSALGLAAGLLIHSAWFWACERFAPPKSAPAPAVQAPHPPPSLRSPERRAGGDRRSGTDRRASGFAQAPVLAVFEETPDIRTFRFARPDGFTFVAGQFLPVRVKADGRDHVRCYSISSSPAARGYLEISVKRQGLVSGTLHTIARPGTTVSVRPPGGSFTYPEGDDRPLVLLAGGIGITPLLSMLRHATEAEPSRRVTLLYSAATEDAFAFKDDIRAIVRRHPQARAFFAVTQGGGSPEFYAGRIDKALVRAAVPDVTNAVAMICGPQPMIDGVRQLLASLGMPEPQIRFERFEAAVAATAGASHASGAASAPRPGDGHDVTCARSQTAVRADAGQTLLDAAEAGGVPIDSLCRSGVCGTCRTRVLEGEISCDSTLLDDADRASGHVLACVAHINSDCVVDL
jgi:ferredoxin-NADP reductase